MSMCISCLLVRPVLRSHSCYTRLSNGMFCSRCTDSVNLNYVGHLRCCVLHISRFYMHTDITSMLLYGISQLRYSTFTSFYRIFALQFVKKKQSLMSYTLYICHGNLGLMLILFCCQFRSSPIFCNLTYCLPF
jgi:hypothetical protein